MAEDRPDGNKKVVLIDMDGVIADFELGFQKAFNRSYPDLIPVPLDQRTRHYVGEDYVRLNPTISKDELVKLFLQPGFFRNLPVIQGSVEAVSTLSQHFSVFVCTSPLQTYKNCVLEKFQWLEEHFGFELTSKVILARDKTVVRGHVLIDDKPNIHGCMSPAWKHVLFTQPYNRSEKTDFRMDGWTDLSNLIGYINSQ